MLNKEFFYIPKQTNPESFDIIVGLADKSKAKAIVLETFLNGAVSEWVPEQITRLIKAGKPVFLVPQGPGHLTDDGRRLGIMDFTYESNMEAYKAGGVPLEKLRFTDFSLSNNPLETVSVEDLEGGNPFEVSRKVQEKFMFTEKEIGNAEIWEEILKRREQISGFQNALEQEWVSERGVGIVRK